MACKRWKDDTRRLAYVISLLEPPTLPADALRSTGARLDKEPEANRLPPHRGTARAREGKRPLSGGPSVREWLGAAAKSPPGLTAARTPPYSRAGEGPVRGKNI